MPPRKRRLLKRLTRPQKRLSNPKPRHAPWLLCAVMTVLAKSAPRLRLQVVVAMENLAASLATSQALDVMANQGVTVVAKALRHVAHVWVMRPSVPNAMRWSQPKTLCVVWLHKPMAKC